MLDHMHEELIEVEYLDEVNLDSITYEDEYQIVVKPISLFDRACNEILGSLGNGYGLLDCVLRKKNFSPEDLFIVSEAKITDTDTSLLEDIFEKVKNSRKTGFFKYSYDKILSLSSQSTWRYYSYFKKNALKNFRLVIFTSDYEDIGDLRNQFLSLSKFFDAASSKTFGIAWPFSAREAYIWLNKSAILSASDSLMRIQHEVIHAWSALLNVDGHKSFGKHSPEQPVDESALDESQAKFLELNEANPLHGSLVQLVNYAIGQDGLEFESQVNDICDGFEHAFKTFIKKDKDGWTKKAVESASLILEKPIDTVLADIGLAGLKNEDSFYYQALVLFYALHGLISGSSKIWYLDEAVKTHMEEDVR